MAKRSIVEVATGTAVLAVTAGFLAYALGHTGRGGADGADHADGAVRQCRARWRLGRRCGSAGVAGGHEWSTRRSMPGHSRRSVNFTIQPDDQAADG